ncbi:MAG: hypothetical protein E4G91_05230 [Candidatus Zixiibacteriota bacterium]|nr:MAG: hypothetical protein E4G91_05230 [candidate division Zixibacteria bacterium]
MILFLLLFSLLGSLSEGSSWDRIQLHSPAQCGYTGVSYLVSSGLTSTQFEEKPIYIYEIGDSVPSAFETTMIREKVVEELNRRRLTRPGVDWAEYPFTTKHLLLEAEYRFPSSPDFVLLRYSSASPIPQHFFVGYALSSGRVYFLAYKIRRQEPDSTLIVFNRMLSENPGLFKESPLCTAYIILMLQRYAWSTPMLVLDSYSDLNRCLSILESWSAEPTPESLLTLTDLYFSGVSKNETLAPFDRWTHERDSIFYLLDSYRYEDSIAISPPRVATHNDTTTIVLTVCGRAGNDLATYQVTLLGNSRVTRIDPLTGQYDGPVLKSLDVFGPCFYYNVPTRDAECDSF